MLTLGDQISTVGSVAGSILKSTGRRNQSEEGLAT
jgi:hypothetical protein